MNISKNKGTFIIAELALSHEGSLGQVFAYIDALSEIGVDAVKLQHHSSLFESSVHEKFRVNIFPQDKTRSDYWERTSFSLKEWKAISKKCKEKNISFVCTPFSIGSLRELIDIGVDILKIGSGESFSSPDLIDACFKSKLPLLISTGMASDNEIKEIQKKIKKSKSFAGIMQCTSMYPTPLEKVGLNILEEYKKSKIPTGLSDHSGSTTPSLFCIAKGYNFLEVHVCFDKRMFGPDIKASLTLEDLSRVVKFRNELNLINENPVNKNEIYNEMKEMRKLFGRSIALKVSQKKGHLIRKEDILMKKPGSGLSYEYLDKVLKRKIVKDLPADHFISLEDLE
jgi:N-acetylneuraminate synthase